MTECTAIPCSEEATHVLTTTVHYDDAEDFTQGIEYCLKDALYFASWPLLLSRQVRISFNHAASRRVV